jgi:hypothetical protein
MDDLGEEVRDFVQYADRLDGDEKGEAQVFLDRLFQAFGHDGYKEAGATLEERVRDSDEKVHFADLVWSDRVLVEMKSRGKNLDKYYDQAREYWHDRYPKTNYVVLCNFDEMWVYDWNVQADPVDKVEIENLPDRYTALNFMLPEEKDPIFRNDRVAVTREAADNVAQAFNSLVDDKGVDRNKAQRLILQSVIAMFSEDAGLLPKDIFTRIIKESKNDPEKSYDLIGGLFEQMDAKNGAGGGMFKDVPYFDGGLFQTIEPVELGISETHYLLKAAKENWRKVQPQVFGTLFQSSMDEERQHALGAHFTSEADIQKVVQPSIVDPWRNRIQSADTLDELAELRKELNNFRVLDPACGSGNFLYIAFRELKRIEIELLRKIHDNYTEAARRQRGIDMRSLLSTDQMFGIDKDPFATELAKVTVTIAKELAVQETREMMESGQIDFAFDYDRALPLDNLDQNIVCKDALFCEWPEADVIIGNPPFQSKNKIKKEYGPTYVDRVREAFPDVPGKADYCVYWFRKAHDDLKEEERAGLVGTNTIRQNKSREGSLDYIVNNGGTITEAVSSQVWSGEATVYVSIVNWIRGEEEGKKKLVTHAGNLDSSPFEVVEVGEINSSLSNNVDVKKARRLEANKESDVCSQGQTHGHEGFLLQPSEAREIVESCPESAEVVYPYMTFDEMLSNNPPGPQRYAIDFHPRDVYEASDYEEPFRKIENEVLPARERKAEEERDINEEKLKENPDARTNTHHQNFLNTWWLFSYAREELIDKIKDLERYFVCGQVTKRPIFEFVSPDIRPNASLIVFAMPDDYSYGILQSDVHWSWFIARCSTLKGDPRYTTRSVFETFPWPQNPGREQVRKVSDAAVDTRETRHQLLDEHDVTLRELYRKMEELPGKDRLRDAHQRLDSAVREAYGMSQAENALSFLKDLNEDLSEKESEGEEIQGPGLPDSVEDTGLYVTEDCIETANDVTEVD